MRFDHIAGGPDQCDPAAGPRWACEGCIEQYEQHPADDQPTCRCEPGDRHPLCPHHGEEIRA